MKINLPRPDVPEPGRTVQQGSTYIAQNIKRESVVLDRNGNEIEPRSKRILKRNTN